MRTKSILVVCPNATDATSFYRGMGPFGALKRSMPLSVAVTHELNWATLGLVDGVFLQRPFDTSHVKAAEITKSNNKPLWVDFDDDLTSVGTDNPTHKIYRGANVEKNIASIISMADVITVSTQYLATSFARFLSPGSSKRILVIPNALNDYLLKCRPRDGYKKSGRMICWRGSATHEKDLMSVGEEIIRLSHELKQTPFMFIAYNPWFLTDQMPHKSTFIVDGMDVIEYHKFMNDISPRIQIAPLFDGPFNRSKSNIAWLESCWAGSVAVAPAWEEWKFPGIANYKSPQDFYEAVKELDECSESSMEMMNLEGWQYITDNLLLSKVNLAREQIMNDVF